MNFKNIAMWAIIVFLTIGLYNMFKNPQSNIRGGNQIIFSDFLTSVDNGIILKVLILMVIVFLHMLQMILT